MCICNPSFDNQSQSTYKIGRRPGQESSPWFLPALPTPPHPSSSPIPKSIAPLKREPWAGELSQLKASESCLAPEAPAFTQQKLIQSLLYSLPIPDALPDCPLPKFHIFPTPYRGVQCEEGGRGDNRNYSRPD